MLTRDERRALLFLSAVAAAGGVMRVIHASSDPPGAPVIAPEIASGDIARQAQLSSQAAALARPLMPGEVVDVDRAEAAELERLPRVGPALARRIDDDRSQNGPFGSLDGLSRVSGIGPGMIKGLERKVVFSGLARPVARISGSREPGAVPAGRTKGTTPDSRLPAVPSCPDLPLRLNDASVQELQCLPGIGPGLAARIVSHRTAHGPFGEVKELQQVPGFGPARLARLAPLLRAP
jgi:competence ComEA-like helix-hairpin-helix protein